MSSSGNPLPPVAVPPPDDLGQRPRGRFQGYPRENTRYSPNEQEARVLKECQKESFWYRALPLGILAGLGASTLIQRGVLTTKTRLGPIPKVVFAACCGYVLGKISYVSTCKKKFLTLGNSPIADMIRTGVTPSAIAAQFGGPMEKFGTGEGAGDAMFTGEGRASVSDDYNSGDSGIDTSLDQDISMESYDNSGVGDAAFATASDERVKPEMTMTYDQLRKRNREKGPQQYGEAHPGLYQPKSGEFAPQKAPARSRSDDGFTLGRASKPRKNEYGDLISDE